DLRQIILTFACIKANYTALFLSPKNSIEGALTVLDAADCNIWVNPAGERATPLVNDFLQQRSMQVMELPELSELLPEDENEMGIVKPFPYTKSWEDAINDTFCILHTSGSTGLSKPIKWTHGLIGTVDAVRLLPPHEGMEPWAKGWDDGDTLYSTFPMSHGAGILMDVVIAPLFGLHCVLGPRDVIPNLELISSLADHIKIDIWSMIPSLTDELGEAPDILPKLSRSKFICASGGPVSNVLGSKVNEFVRVLNLTGTSEGLFIGNLWVDRQDWHWFAFHPWSGFDFKMVEPGLYEQWIHHNEHADLFQGLFQTFQDVKSFNFKDLYVPHPTKPGFWASHGRSDDVVVLSNGYKISPLDTEALITTHPAVEGCVMIGSGKPQAGLLIELKDPLIKRDDDNAEALFNSIWNVIERANSLSLHKDQLHRDYIAFSEPDKPFIRTEKRTIKRRATLMLYADYVERFYQSRTEDDSSDGAAALGLLTIDTASLDSTTRAVRHVLSSIVPAVKNAPADADLFTLGFDSLLVFRATKTIAAATDLGGKFSPRNFYAGPTIEAIAATVVRLAAERRAMMTTNGTVTASPIEQKQEDPRDVKIRGLINRHKAVLSSKLGPMDLFGGNMYEGINVFLPLCPGVSFEEAYKVLQQGLARAMEIVPDLAGKVIPCSEHEIGYKKGDLRLSLSPLPSTVFGTSSSQEPRQLHFRDLSSVLPSYAEQKASGFLTSAYPDELLTTCPAFPDLPADVCNIQANFIEGGCVLAFNVHHHAFDGIGLLIALKVWAECCQFVQGNQSATCEWLHPESLNRDMLSVLYEVEGFAKPAHEIDPRVWGFLPYSDPALKNKEERRDGDKTKLVTATANGLVTKPNTDKVEKLEKLQKSVELAEAADPESQSLSKGSGSLSLPDVLQAFFWRAAVRARRRPENSSPDDTSIIEMPTDVRPYFSAHLPPTYMANGVIMNRQYMSVSELCSSETSLYKIAQICRQTRTRIDQELVHDAFGLLHTIQDNSPGNHATAFLGQGIQDGPHSLFNNMMLFQAKDIGVFGGGIFDAPNAVRVQMDWLNKAFRSLFILPIREDGGVELLLGTLSEELDAMMNDAEFMQFAEFLGPTDAITESPSSQSKRMPHQTPDYQNISQEENKATKVAKTMNTTKGINTMDHTIVIINQEPSINKTDVSPDHTNVSGPDLLKLKTPAITIAASDVSFDDTMSTRSSSSSLATEMTGPLATDDITEDPSEAKVSETSERILDVILEYSLNKFDSTAELHTKGRPKFLTIISHFVRAQQKAVMCLPAFPFKSANTVEKVLGNLPDKAEELSLARLDSMCATIGRFYEPGAELTIISDGLVYNDLLGISDLDTWRYGSALRAMAERKDFSNLAFSRLQDLVAVKGLPNELNELTYVANATNFRRTLFNKYGRDDDLDIDHEIGTNMDTLGTYKGYCRFLKSDLQHIYGPAKSSAKYRKDVKYLAKQLLVRGYLTESLFDQAFAGAVKARFPHHLRLSIHQSTGEHKISLSLLNTKSGFTTPWHCSVALMEDGEWLSGLAIDFKADRLLELVEEDGRPSYFREVARQRPYLTESAKPRIVVKQEPQAHRPRIRAS
ncbi:unnamed protein product, partial [Fusarium langsethiae]